MKKVIALLAAVIVLAGSMEMKASAATTACDHSSHKKVAYGDISIETYTHSVQVGTSTSGKPLLAACLVEIGRQRYQRVCNMCGKVITSYTEKIYEVHSMH